MRALYGHILLLSGHKLASFPVEQIRSCGLLRPDLCLLDFNGVGMPQMSLLADLYELSEEWFEAGPGICLHGAEVCLLKYFIAFLLNSFPDVLGAKFYHSS